MNKHTQQETTHEHTENPPAPIRSKLHTESHGGGTPVTGEEFRATSGKGRITESAITKSEAANEQNKKIHRHPSITNATHSGKEAARL